MKHEVVYMTAEQLGITELEREGLLQIKGELERGELRHVTDEAEIGEVIGFTMASWCGTACCIGGWLETRKQLSAYGKDRTRMHELFYPSWPQFNDYAYSYRSITPAQAARAIGNFLSLGNPHWAEACAK